MFSFRFFSDERFKGLKESLRLLGVEKWFGVGDEGSYFTQFGEKNESQFVFRIR